MSNPKKQPFITVDDRCLYLLLDVGSRRSNDRLRELEHFDISSNEFTGHIDVLRFPSLTYANFSNNRFTTAGFRRFHKSYYTLRKLDLSSNLLTQDVYQLFLNIPPTLKDCVLSENNIGGTLPEEFPLKEVLFFTMSSNIITGPLPDFPNTSPKLKVLKLANNLLTGSLQEDFFKLGDLSALDLAGNHLSGSIPASIGDLTQLSMLRLSSNSLARNIPVKLAKLEGRWFLFITYDLTSKFEIETT